MLIFGGVWYLKTAVNHFHEPPMTHPVSPRSALKRARLVPMYLGLATLATGVPGPQNERFTPEILMVGRRPCLLGKKAYFQVLWLLVSGRVVLTKFWIFLHLEIVLKLEISVENIFSTWLF